MERCGSGRTAGPFAAAVVGLIAAVTVVIVETGVVDVPTALIALGAFAALMRFNAGTSSNAFRNARSVCSLSCDIARPCIRWLPRVRTS
jgi:hypothetical protein